MNEKAPTRKQRLNLDLHKSYSIKKPHKLHTGKIAQRTLRQIGRKWAAQGFYTSPSQAMKALLQGGEPWN